MSALLKSRHSSAPVACPLSAKSGHPVTPAHSMSAAARLHEWAALYDAVQLLANGLPIGVAPGIGRRCRHAQSPK